uniref:Supervillin b n=3 Tax=Nothobranchius TaxID=28779 RepID=A0A1A8BL09_NOTKA
MRGGGVGGTVWKTYVHHLHQRVFSSNTVTWLPTRMPSSHLDTEMAFLSDKSIVYTFTSGAALTTTSAVPLPKGGALFDSQGQLSSQIPLQPSQTDFPSPHLSSIPYNIYS